MLPSSSLIVSLAQGQFVRHFTNFCITDLPCRIYATPSTILRSSGSVGVSFIMWLFGAFIATCGTVVYIEFGTGLPRNGGEKNYLEFVYRHPRFLASCGFMMYTFIMVRSRALILVSLITYLRERLRRTVLSLQNVTHPWSILITHVS